MKRLSDPVELLYLALMLRWERTAPPDQHQGSLDGLPVRNTQIARMADLLRKIGAGESERVFRSLARYARRNDGRSYISKDHAWMIEPCPLLDGWFFEGCVSLERKQAILQNLTKLGFSSDFVACTDEFVAGRSIQKYLPTDEEQAEIVIKLRQLGAASEQSAATGDIAMDQQELSV
jgi:hypothetical protein